MGRKVAIVGFAETYKLAPFDDPSVEIWGINELHKYLPRWDRWFELHARESFEIIGNRGQEDHVRWLQAQPPVGDSAHKPVFMRELFDDIPAGVRYPLEAMTARFWGAQGEQPYWSSSIGFMLALAIAEGRDERHQVVDPDTAVGWIGLYGIDLAADTEYGEQRPNAEYFIGLARGLGMEVVVAAGSALLKHDHIYGFERRGDREGPVGAAFLDARIKELREKRDKTLDILHTLDGALEEAMYHRKVVDHARRGVSIQKKAS